MEADQFAATFVLGVDRATAWNRLADHPDGWMPGFDSLVTVVESVEGERLHVTKDDEPCAGTHIVVTLEEAETGTRITVVQSGFGDALAGLREMMAVGWRHLVSDLQTFLATGAHVRRHLRAWGDLGAPVTAVDGGLLVGTVRDGTLAARLGLRAGDLLVVLAGAPVSSLDDLVTVLRVVGPASGSVSAEWVRDGVVLDASG